MRALIVDDDMPTTQAIRQSIDWDALSLSDVFIAHNIDKAKSLIIEHQPHIIICDIEMPRGSGIDLIRWARESGFDSRFIFLTCHEEFHFATAAIQYEADAYITKPFDVKGMQAAISTVVEKILYQSKLQQYKGYGERWMSNLHTRENSFWRDLLFGSIPLHIATIQSEIELRGLECDVSVPRRLLLCSVRESQLDEGGHDKPTFRFSLCRLVNSELAGSPEIVRTLDYTANGSVHVVKVLDAGGDRSALEAMCESLIAACMRTLRCELTCYLGGEVLIDELVASRLALEEADAYNLSRRGRVVADIAGLASGSEPYTFDSNAIKRLIHEERGVEAVNLLRHELESLAAIDRLNSEIMLRIQHDYLQIIYSVLYENNVQAHELFSDTPSQKLYQASGFSAFDMMKWVSHITAKTFQHIKEIRETESVVNKIKRFIAENYMKKITREEIAAIVFLSPDYVSKIFHSETGLFIKDYLNEVRIGRAKFFIKDGGMNVSEVAALVGFDNFSYFSSLFKKSTGLSPSEYRKQEQG